MGVLLCFIVLEYILRLFRSSLCLLKSQNVPLFPLLGSSEILQQETIKVLYPKISSTENIDCECNMSFESVHWFRSISKYSKIQYIGKCNNADRDFYGTDVDKARYKISRKSNSFSLRIHNVTEEDTGIYSCVLKGKKTMEVWKSGILLQPGGLYAEICLRLLNIKRQ